MAGSGFKGRPDLASEAGKKGAATLKERLGRDYFVRMGKRGGATVKATKPPGYYSEIGKKGGQTRWARRKAREAAQSSESETP